MDDLNDRSLPPLEDDGSTLGLDKIELYRRLVSWYRASEDHSRQWRAEAKEDFGFVAGDQWSKDERSYLEDQKRPVITFNRTLAIIKAICGLEINSRHETIYMPRGTSPGEVRANEVLTSAGQWMADQSDAEDEQSTAFQDAVICGMGWCEARIDFEIDQDGAYVEDRVDPIEMYWDASSRKKNLTDARYMFRVRKMTLAEARDMFPGVPDTELDAPWAYGADATTDPKPIELRRKKTDPTDYDDIGDKVHIVHAQWYERVPYWRVTNPMSGQIEEVDDQAYKGLAANAKASGVKLASVKQTKRVYKQAFLGASILGDVMPSPAGDRFSWGCITGEAHRNRGTWYGLVRVMRDPQKWANKWLSQTLHILNTTAKGGIIAEAKAFKDMRQAQDTYAQPDAITWAADGAISQGKIMQKPGVGLPTGYVNLLEFAISSIRDASGVNLELLGMRDVNQPGILEAQRKQAGMTILATLFDSLRRFRKQIGRIRLYYIQNYLADGRLIRIVKDDAQQIVPLLRDEALGEYEVIVEDAPTSANMKEQTWATIQQVLPAFQGLMTPESVIAILEYSPLPSKLVSAFKDMASKPSPDAEITKAMQQIKLQREQAAAHKDEAAAEKTRLDGVLALAQAGVQAAQLGLLGATQNIMSPEPWKIQPGIEDAMIVPPNGSGLQGPALMPGMPAAPMPSMGPSLPKAPNDGAESLPLPMPPMPNGIGMPG